MATKPRREITADEPESDELERLRRRAQPDDPRWAP